MLRLFSAIGLAAACLAGQPLSYDSQSAGREPPAPIRISAAAGPVHLDVKMQPLPKVSGRVLDSDRKPVAGAPVGF